MATSGQVQVLGQPQQVPRDPAFDVQAVVHQLAEVVLLAEDVAEFRGGLHRLPVLAESQPGLDLAGRAARGGDQPFGVGVEQFTVEAGPLAEDGSREAMEEARNRFRMPALL